MTEKPEDLRPGPITPATAPLLVDGDQIRFIRDDPYTELRAGTVVTFKDLIDGYIEIHESLIRGYHINKFVFVERLSTAEDRRRLQAMTDLDLLRAAEGASVMILCDNPEAESAATQCAIDVNDDWTDWKDRRFYGRDVADCLAKAIEARP